MRGRGNGKHRLPGDNKNRVFDSNGPEVRVRGTAHQVLEKYLALARDAASSGDRIAAENYFQHAEHYYRIIHADGGNGQPRYPQPHRELTVSDRPFEEPAEEGAPPAAGSPTSVAAPLPAGPEDAPPVAKPIVVQ
jgi:hypothetical protein